MIILRIFKCKLNKINVCINSINIRTLTIEIYSNRIVGRIMNLFNVHINYIEITVIEH